LSRADRAVIVLTKENNSANSVCEADMRISNTFGDPPITVNWHDTVHDDAVYGDGGNIALVYEVTPTTAFGFDKGTSFSQTRWRFS
jgi:hypothetical protein